MYELIIFDWDGTLMDSAQKIANCIHASAQDVGLPQVTDQQAKNIIGLGLSQAMNTLYPNITTEQIKAMVERYRYHFITADKTQQKLFSGVESGLNELLNTGVLLAVATGKARAGLDKVLSTTQLHDLFTYTRCADESRSKPHPQMLHDVLDFTAIDPSNSIMIGDTSYDMEMAQSASVHGLAVSYGVHTLDQLHPAEPQAVLDSFEQVIDWLLTDRVKAAYD